MNALAKSVRFDDSMMWVSLADGRQLGVPLAFFPRLLQAQPEQRAAVVISGGGLGLHWDELDEDISVPALLAGHDDMTATRHAEVDKAWLNVARCRRDELASGEVAGVPGEDVFKRIAARQLTTT